VREVSVFQAKNQFYIGANQHGYDIEKDTGYNK
jgi:hypothetical protein